MDKILFENDIIEVFDTGTDWQNIDCIARIYNKTTNDITIQFYCFDHDNFELDDIVIIANGFYNLFADCTHYKMLALLVKGCFTVEIVEHDIDLEALNEEILWIVKCAVNNNATTKFDTDCIEINSNQLDHIAEEVAEEVCKLIAKGGN